MSLYFDNATYLFIYDAEKEQTLLDCSFPDLSDVKYGCTIIKPYACGIPRWQELRKLSIWHSNNNMRADVLEKIVGMDKVCSISTSEGTSIKDHEDLCGISSEWKDDQYCKSNESQSVIHSSKTSASKCPILNKTVPVAN